MCYCGDLKKIYFMMLETYNCLTVTQHGATEKQLVVVKWLFLMSINWKFVNLSAISNLIGLVRFLVFEHYRRLGSRLLAACVGVKLCRLFTKTAKICIIIDPKPHFLMQKPRWLQGGEAPGPHWGQAPRPPYRLALRARHWPPELKSLATPVPP